MPSFASATKPLPVERTIRNRALLALAAFALILGWQAVSVSVNYRGNWTALFCTGDLPHPPELTDTYVFRNSPGYDGQFYRYVAHDPLMRKGYAQYIDDARLRYQRVLIPALAAAGGAHIPGGTDAAYILVTAAFLALGVYWCAAWAQAVGQRARLGALFLLSPGALASIDRLVLDGPFTALFWGFAAALAANAWRAAYVIVLLACLMRETGVLLLAGAIGWLLWKRQWFRAVLFSTAASPAFMWGVFVWRNTHPTAYKFQTYPVIGIVIRLFEVRRIEQPGAALLQVLDVVALIGFVTTIAIAFVWIRRFGLGPVEIAVALFAAIGLASGTPEVMQDAMGYARPVSPMISWVLLNAASRGAWSAAVPPLATSLHIGAFLASPFLRTTGLLGR